MKLFNKIRWLFEHKPLIIVAAIVLVGLLLRSLNFRDNIIFAYDQARDAQRIMDMVYNHKLKLVGPETDIPGVFNGVLFYLILLPAYAVSGFDPNAASFLLVLLNLCVIPLLYYFSAVLFRNKYVGYLAGLLWAVSFEQINFAKYISNASLMPVSTTVFFLGLAVYLFSKKDWGLIASSVGLAASIHFNFYLVYLFIFYPVFFLIYRPKINWKTVAVSCLLFAVILLPFLVAEIKWHFQATKGLLNYFAGHAKQAGGPPLSYKLTEYYKRLSEMSHFSFAAIGKYTAAIAVIPVLLVGFLKMEKKPRLFLLVSFFSTLPLFFFNSGVMTVQVINSSIFSAVTLIVAYGVYQLGRLHKIIPVAVMAGVFVSSFYLLSQNRFANNSVFASHPQLLKYEKQLIDYSYASSKRKSFSVCGIMNPLFTNTIWSFLYKTYGEKKYGYVPAWAGQKQFITANYLPKDLQHVNDRYIIVEPVGIPDFARTATVYLEDQRSGLVEKKYFGEYQIQKRVLLTQGSQPNDTQRLPKNEIESILRIVNADPRYYCYLDYRYE